MSSLHTKTLNVGEEDTIVITLDTGSSPFLAGYTLFNKDMSATDATFDEKDVVQEHLLQTVLGLYEDAFSFIRICGWCAGVLEPLERFLGGGKKIGIGYGLEEIVQRTYLESFQGILAECGSEDDLGGKGERGCGNVHEYHD